MEVPEIRITEPQFVERGEPVMLQCNATGEFYAPEEMDWFRNGQKLVSDVSKGLKISKQFSIPKKRFTSVLVIERAEMTDDGTYVCRSSNTQITSTKVLVLNGNQLQYINNSNCAFTERISVLFKRLKMHFNITKTYTS